jgi:DNA-directed RNA polymerase subunit alpha
MQYDIILPSKPRIVSEEDNKGVYEIDGLYAGYGYTLGNALRRVLLSSLPGAAATSVKIEGVSHEFSTISGVKEDIILILLNLKQIRFKMHADEPQTVTLSAKGPKKITAKDLTAPSQVEILNKDAPIANLTAKDAKLKLELTVEKGLGYVPREVLQKEKVGIGTLLLDAIFTPIRKVNYEVENMRVGERTDYNRLRFVIETDGSISPKEALEQAVKIVIKQLESIAGVEEKMEEIPLLEKEIEKIPMPVKEFRVGETKKEESGISETEILKTRIEDLNLSSRISSALSDAGIRTIGGLTRKKESDLLELEGIGKKAVDQIKEALAKLGLSLK